MFSIPFSVVYESQYGVVLVANAVAGIEIVKTRIVKNPECNQSFFFFDYSIYKPSNLEKQNVLK